MGGVLKYGERELMIHCLPNNLPEKITVDISKMLPGDYIHVSDIELGDGFEILTASNNVIVAVEKPKAVSEETETPEKDVAAEESGKE